MRLNAPAPSSPFGRIGNKLEAPASSASLTPPAGQDMKLGSPGSANKGFGAALMASQTAQSLQGGSSDSLSSTRLSMANDLASDKGGGASNSAILGLLTGPGDNKAANSALSNSLTLGK